ncbi:MAG: MBL fold metallo-hydrolase [Gemmatimonadaceae bacterium]
MIEAMSGLASCLTTSSRCIGAITALSLAIVPGALSGQQSASRQPPQETQILLLGTAGGPPLRKGRSEPATLLIVDGRRYLIDCGIGTARRLLEADIGSQTIGTIFLTHLHPDHDLGLADVLANDFQERDLIGSNRTISIYGPPQTKALVDAAYHYISIPYAVFAAEGGGPTGGVPAMPPFSVHEIGEGVVYQDDKIRVVAAENSHYALMPQSSRSTMKSYSYRFETPHGVVVFTGDTGPSDAVVRLADGADLLVSEVSDFVAVNAFVDRIADANHWPPERRNQFRAHMTGEHLDIKDVGQIATRSHVKSVLLYHWNPADPATYVAGVAKYFSGPVFASADLQRYCLGASSAAGQSSRQPLHVCE